MPNDPDFCKCEHSKSVHTEVDDFGYWYVCDTCGKPVEDTYEYFNTSEDDFL